MYKAKYKIWIVLFLLSLLIYNFSSIMIWIPKTTHYETYISLNEKNLIERIGMYKKSWSKLDLVSSQDKADIIIKNSSDEKIEGYTKYDNQFTSPIVMFVPNKCYIDSDTGFIHKTYGDSSSTNKYIEKNLLSILEAIEKDKNYSDIGIADKLFSGDKVTLAIPDKNAEGYNEVVLLIKLTLNNYSYENINDTSLQKRTDAIINKCVKYEDAVEYTLNILNNKKAEKTIILAPEYTASRDYHLDSVSNSGQSYVECLPDKTINISYDMYLKNQEVDGYYNKLFKSLKKSKFYNEIGLRNKEMDFEVNDYRHTSNIITIIK